MNGKWVSGPGFPFNYAKEIRKVQLVQRERFVVDLYLVPMRDYNDETATFMHRELNKKLGESMDILIHRVDEVPYLKPGKFKFVIWALKNTP